MDMGIAKTLSLAIFEMTSGVQSATEHFYNQAIFPFLIAAIISMNGLSIHMQVFVIAKTVNIPMTPYVGQNLERSPCAFHPLFDYVGTNHKAPWRPRQKNDHGEKLLSP